MKALTIGTFDCLHYGHLHLLMRCGDLADEVVVGVNSDRFVMSYKQTPPLFSEIERIYALETLGYEVELNTSSGRELIESVEPDLLVIGSDWARKDYLAQIGVTQDWLDERSIIVAYVPYTRGISTTLIKERLSA
jgi:glycerol-3-phosphate cytidylyltransferase